MTRKAAIAAPRVFDGSTWHDDSAVVFIGDTVGDIADAADLPSDCDVTTLSPGCLVPGFVDLQVNGGGGVLLNDDPTVEAIERICRAHAPFGTTALLPTLITDTPEITGRAAAAAAEAIRKQIPGCAGLHLEGPHLSEARRGAHDAELVRAATEADIVALIEAQAAIGHLMVTMAPESVSLEQVARLAETGIRVSLGHSAAGFVQATAMLNAGAHMVTHLFNAMSPLAHREPGVVGATLENGAVYAGLIADGIHVDPATMAIAIRAKKGPGKIFLGTDAMSTIGSDLTAFTLNGREIRRADGRLTLADGTLAGADIDMIASVRVVHQAVGLSLEEALRMASLYPAEAMGMADRYGCLKGGSRADMVHLSDDLQVNGTWIGGVSVR